MGDGVAQESRAKDVGILERMRRIDLSDAAAVADRKFEMRFQFRDVPLVARIVPHESGSLHMQLMGIVGRLPYSAEGHQRRTGTMLLLRSTANRRPTRFGVTRAGNIALAGDIEVVAPVTPTRLIVAVTTLVASAKPYLDIFQMFVEPVRPGRT